MLKAIWNRIKPRRKLHNRLNNSGVAVAKWCIQQFCVCPNCDHEFDIIKTNLTRVHNQGTIKVTQKVVNRYDKNKFEYEEITAEIPTPPYFGAFCENTENLDEHIKCPSCEADITINEAHWGFGRD